MLRELYIREGDGIAIVYSVTCKRSFESAMSIAAVPFPSFFLPFLRVYLLTFLLLLFCYMKDIKRVMEGERMPVILVANKSDVKENRLKKEVGEVWAISQGFRYFETSAKTGENVVELFHDLIRLVDIERQVRAEAFKSGPSKRQRLQNKLSMSGTVSLKRKRRSAALKKASCLMM